ncbi:MAG: hypothetical protein U5L75_02940 [Candidatus Campbellbacteria bacterium]|nr:hypothetical protein [Candidatus Campbellbacteria bacterium]
MKWTEMNAGSIRGASKRFWDAHDKLAKLVAEALVFNADFRKNFARYARQCTGVDLVRLSDKEWDLLADSSSLECFDAEEMCTWHDIPAGMLDKAEKCFWVELDDDAGLVVNQINGNPDVAQMIAIMAHKLLVDSRGDEVATKVP